MRHLLICATILLLFWGSTNTTLAQSERTKSAGNKTERKSSSGASKRTNFGGDVLSVSNSSITVKTPKGEMIAHFNTRTKLTGGQAGQKISDLKSGDRVRVWVTSDDSGGWTATTIRLLPAKKRA